MSKHTEAAAVVARLDAEYRRAADKGTGEVAEEGLYRTAACAERLGDTDGAGAALRDYLKRYPAGPHASAAATALGAGTPGR